MIGLVIAGADLETRNSRGETGLDLAIRSGMRDAVLTFLDKGVNGYNREECLQKSDNNKKLVGLCEKPHCSTSRYQFRELKWRDSPQTRVECRKYQDQAGETSS